MASYWHWSRELIFKSRVRECQNIFGERNKVERFSVRLPDPVEYYCGFRSLWMQYKPPTLLFVSVPSYAPTIVVLRRGSGADQARICTIVLTEYVIMMGSIFVVYD